LRNTFLTLSLFIIGCSSKPDVVNGLKSEKWISRSTPKCEVWFQNWSNYTRLFITIESDTFEVNPSPYVTEKKGKPYLMPKSYNKVQKQQLIGNLYWDENLNWDDGSNIQAIWEVDRANPKILLPKKYGIDFSISDDILKMLIMNEADTLISVDLDKLNSY
tara:strand:- start:942 stop:1424 length:483 start_codon:yes stop_codon:yes gene_type:complete